MPGDSIDIIQRCSVCGTEISRFPAKKENMFLTSYKMVACPKCGRETPELREPALRAEMREKEAASLPKNNH